MSNSFGPDEAWITPSLAGQLGISHKNLEGEWANKYTRTDIHDTALARIAELEAALRECSSANRQAFNRYQNFYKMMSAVETVVDKALKFKP